MKKTLLTNTALIALATMLNINMLSARDSNLNKEDSSNNTSQTTIILDDLITNKNMSFGMHCGDNIMNQSYIEINRGIDKNKFVYGVWTNFDTKEGIIVEIDQMMGYNFTRKINKGSISVQPTFAYYSFPNSTFSDCQEIFATTTYSGPVDIKIRGGKIFGKDSGKGFIIGTNILKKVDLSDKLACALNIGGTYNSHYIASNSKGISHIETTTSAIYRPRSNLSITTSYTIQKLVDKSFEGRVKNESYAKIGITYIF